jgi:transaldolase
VARQHHPADARRRHARALHRELSITGLTSNPTIFEHAIGKGDAYDEQIATLARAGRSGEDLFIQLALRDLTRAADLFRPRTTPPAASTAGPRSRSRRSSSTMPTRRSARSRACTRRRRGPTSTSRSRARRPASGDRGIDLRRRADQRDAAVLARAVRRRRRSVSARHRAAPRRRARSEGRVGRVAVREPLGRRGQGPSAAEKRNRLGIAVARRTYKAYRELLGSPRWQKLAAAGAHPQRLLWASTGTKDPAAPDTLYVEALAAPDTIDTIPDKTLEAFAEHGKVGAPMALDGGDAESVIAEFRALGIDDGALAEQLQKEGADAFAKSWKSLLDGIADKTSQLSGAASR